MLGVQAKVFLHLLHLGPEGCPTCAGNAVAMRVECIPAKVVKVPATHRGPDLSIHLRVDQDELLLQHLRRLKL